MCHHLFSLLIHVSYLAMFACASIVIYIIYRISKKLGADDNWWVCVVANDAIILPVGFEPI